MSASVFILEDEPILALEIEDHLRSAGFQVAGVAGSVAQALRDLQTMRFDVGVLDANLRGESSGKVAAALVDLDTPFFCISGYGRDALPPDLADAPLLPKPFTRDQLVGAVRSLLSER
jgi:DNA-binding response OmpR family regulator